ncbi:MAG: glycosyltransferase [Bryobacteraceae bacterium]|nr:glycosyltransferase [Bryobacteraceae bacterium]
MNLRGNADNRNLLAISWAMPPLLLPRAIQVPRTLKALSSLGWRAKVLCAETAVIDRTLPHDDKLKEISAGDYETIVVKPPLLLRPAHTAIGYRLLRKASLVDQAWQRWAARIALRLARAERFDALITFAQPWPDHLIGLDIRRRTGLPWAAHFSDPWVDSPYINKSDPRYPEWRRQEAEVVREADAVAFTTEHAAELVMRKYPVEYRDKVHVVPHGYDRDFLRIIGAPPENKRLRLVSTGNFYGARTPLPLLAALERLNGERPLADELEVVLVGGNNLPYAGEAARMGLERVVSCRDSVPFLESLRIAGTADALLVIDAPSDGASVFLPSKLIDYLMFEKPILGITPLEGSSADLLRRAGCPVAAPEDTPAITAAVSDLLERRRAGTLGVAADFTAVAREYDIASTTRLLDCILRKIGGPGRVL